jgi:hypothetical protein
MVNRQFLRGLLSTRSGLASGGLKEAFGELKNMETIELGTTTQYSEPTWTGGGFAELEAQNLWLRLPNSLRMIALEEIAHGNTVESVLDNRLRGIVLLCFSRGPLGSGSTDQSIRVHTEHDYGNYCYDGTAATYEDLASGCFLAFGDPFYVAD